MKATLSWILQDEKDFTLAGEDVRTEPGEKTDSAEVRAPYLHVPTPPHTLVSVFYLNKTRLCDTRPFFTLFVFPCR